MDLTYQLPVDLSERLEEEARRRGQDPAALLLDLVTGGLPASAPTPLDSLPDNRDGPEAEAMRFRRWADGHRRAAPVIPLEAMDREHIYEARG